ncbi:MAG TPA: LysR family transcriptional regulator, partial [Alphaproteobacteria bacterium]|nr:LysR family transcriptional regulator [Alphaproteobacteria bacterium]
MDKLAALTVFRRVVERGGFAAAARDLGLSNPAVSKQIAALETGLGARLLNRTTRRLALTEDGRAFYERTCRILDDLAEAELAVGDAARAPRGTLKVNAPMSFGLAQLAPRLPEFMALHPGVTVDLALDDRVVDPLEGGFDVALRIRTHLPDSSLVARRLAPVGRALVAAPAYLARRGAPADPDDLAGHDCLTYALAAQPGRWAFDGPDGRREVAVRGRLVANNALALRLAVLAGQGLTLTPRFVVADDIAAGRLVPLLPDWRAEGHALYA